MQVGKIEQLTTNEKPPRTMPHTFARQADTIKRLQRELDAANESVNQWMEYYHNAAAEKDAVLDWSRRAYMRLNGLMELRVSISPDVVTASIVNEAPDSVKGGAA